MIPPKIKIESFAKRCHMGTLGGKGLEYNNLSLKFQTNLAHGKTI